MLIETRKRVALAESSNGVILFVGESWTFLVRNATLIINFESILLYVSRQSCKIGAIRLGNLISV